VEKSLNDLVGLLKKLHRDADAAPFEARLSAIQRRQS
jgi:hypothetical protein